MFIKTLVLFSFIFKTHLVQVPTPPDSQQFTIAAEKPKDSPQIEVTTNQVGRVADIFHIHVTNEGRLSEQAFYYGANKRGHLIYYNNLPRCDKINEHYADMLQEWQTLSQAGKRKFTSNPHLECNMCNKTIEFGREAILLLLRIIRQLKSQTTVFLYECCGITPLDHLLCQTVCLIYRFQKTHAKNLCQLIYDNPNPDFISISFFILSFEIVDYNILNKTFIQYELPISIDKDPIRFNHNMSQFFVPQTFVLRLEEKGLEKLESIELYT